MDRDAGRRVGPSSPGGHRKSGRSCPAGPAGGTAPRGAGPGAAGRGRGPRPAGDRHRLLDSAPPRLCAPGPADPPRMTAGLLGALLGAALMQGQGPTVGDTVWLSRTVAVPAGSVVRAADWDPADPIELLGRPRITLAGDSAQIAYQVVVWQPGQQVVEVPGPLLLGPGGSVDSLRGQSVRLDVQSVLPRGPVDSIAPQPRADIVPIHTLSPIPLLILWALSLALLLPLHFWWRRRGKPTRPALPVPALVEPPLNRWADDGEYRAVANMSAVRLRSAVAQRVSAAHPGLDTERLLSELAAVRPDWPLDELGEILRGLDEARFGVTPASDVLALSESSVALRARILGEAA